MPFKMTPPMLYASNLQSLGVCPVTSETSCHWKCMRQELNLARNSSYCDVEVNCQGGLVLKAHSSILAACSDFFRDCLFETPSEVGHSTEMNLRARCEAQKNRGCYKEDATHTEEYSSEEYENNCREKRQSDGLSVKKNESTRCAQNVLLKNANCSINLSSLSAATVQTVLNFIYGIVPNTATEINNLYEGCMIMKVNAGIRFCQQYFKNNYLCGEGSNFQPDQPVQSLPYGALETSSDAFEAFSNTNGVLKGLVECTEESKFWEWPNHQNLPKRELLAKLVEEKEHNSLQKTSFDSEQTMDFSLYNDDLEDTLNNSLEANDNSNVNFSGRNQLKDQKEVSIELSFKDLIGDLQCPHINKHHRTKSSPLSSHPLPLSPSPSPSLSTFPPLSLSSASHIPFSPPLTLPPISQSPSVEINHSSKIPSIEPSTYIEYTHSSSSFSPPPSSSFSSPSPPSFSPPPSSLLAPPPLSPFSPLPPSSLSSPPLSCLPPPSFYPPSSTTKTAMASLEPLVTATQIPHYSYHMHGCRNEGTMPLYTEFCTTDNFHTNYLTHDTLNFPFTHQIFPQIENTIKDLTDLQDITQNFSTMPALQTKNSPQSVFPKDASKGVAKGPEDHSDTDRSFIGAFTGSDEKAVLSAWAVDTSVKQASYPSSGKKVNTRQLSLVGEDRNEASKERPNSTERNMLKKMKETTFECTDCGALLRTCYRLQAHLLKEHKKGKLFSCRHCAFKSPRKKDLQAHTLSQHGEKPEGVTIYTCSVCQYNCIDKNRFEEHESMHQGILKYKCFLCAKAYTTRRGMRTHLKYHSDNRPFTCHLCVASFKVKNKLSDHLKLVHLQKGFKPFKCNYCDHWTALRGNCNQHIKKTHPGLPIVVIDTKEKKTTRSYGYAGLLGGQIDEEHEISARHRNKTNP